MRETTLGVCVIGTGRAGMIHARGIAGGVPGAHLAAIADVDKDALAKAKDELKVEVAYQNYAEALEDSNVDALVIVTPTVIHREVVLAAAAAGRHVFCEKPMAMNGTECDEMIRACTDAGVKLQIGFMRRFDRDFREAKRRIDAGEIGEVVLVKSVTRGPSVPQPWMLDVRKSNGPLAEVNSHDIDIVRWYTGSEVEEVYAIAGNYRCGYAREEYPDFYDNHVMTMRFVNGMQGVIDGAASVGYGYDARTEILGTRGVLFAGRIEDTSVVSVTPSAGVVRPAVASWRGLFAEAYREEIASFVRSIIDDSEPEVTGLDGKMAVEIVNAGNLSIRERRPVKLADQRKS